MNNPKSICILGRLPALGLAELESLYGADHVWPINNAALLDVPAEDINFKRLGGSVKVARVLTTLPYTDWRKISSYLKDNIPQHVEKMDEGKFTLGLSVYDRHVQVNDITKLLLQIKKSIKATGRSVRVLQNKTAELSSATVFHNKLTHKGAWELLLVPNGSETILAQTLFVQDIEAYAARDQTRPKRDARVGMLPPKLAQTVINLATGRIEQSTDNSDGRAVRVLDPFCGTGVLLQEAMLMGYNVLGTDLEPRMVEYAKENLQWLVEKYPKTEASVDVEVADATNFVWPRFSVVASETYLGRPFNTFPSDTDLKQAISDVNTILKKFLVNLSGQMKSGQVACLAVPAWQQPNGSFVHLPLIDHLTEMGYNYLELKHVPKSKLVYYREDQVVARQLIRIEKK